MTEAGPRITGINGSVSVCYEVFFNICLLSANYVDQLIITPGTFSGGGDSGSLIVTDDANKNRSLSGAMPYVRQTGGLRRPL